MQNLTTKFFFCLFFIAFFSSCTIEKRQYMSGYYIQWKHGGETSQVNSNPQNSLGVNTTESIKQDENTIPKENIIVNENTIVASNNKQIILQEKISLQKTTSTNLTSNKTSITSPVFTRENKLKKQNRLTKRASVGGVILQVFGWIFFGLGFLIFLLANIAVGIIIMILGLIFIIPGMILNHHANKRNDSTSDKKDDRTLQDVVYLKNGSVIRGIIIEQIPNQSIKIKTKDGNIFVYKMDDIMKTTKE